MEIELALDIGFGDCKAVFSNGNGISTFKYPTAVSHADSTGTFVNGYINERIFEYRKSKFFIAETAARDSISTQSYDFMKKYVPLFTYFAMEKVREKSGVDVSQVALGLPLTYFNKGEKEIKPLIDNLQVDGKQFSFDSRFYPQCFGAVCEYRMSDLGIIKPGTAEDMIVVDIGFNTVDVCTVEKGKVIPRGTTTRDKQGVCRITDGIRNSLTVERHATISDHEAVEILRNGLYIEYGKTIRCEELVNKAKKNYAEALFADLASKWENYIRRSVRILLVGGGAHLVSDHVPERYKDMVTIPENPEYANARGYLKCMRFQRRPRKPTL